MRREGSKRDLGAAELYIPFLEKPEQWWSFWKWNETRPRAEHVIQFRHHFHSGTSIPDSSALNLLDELPRRRLVAVLVDQADGEYHRLELGAEIGGKEEKFYVKPTTTLSVNSWRSSLNVAVQGNFLREGDVAFTIFPSRVPLGDSSPGPRINLVRGALLFLLTLKKVRKLFVWLAAQRAVSSGEQ